MWPLISTALTAWERCRRPARRRDFRCDRGDQRSVLADAGRGGLRSRHPFQKRPFRRGDVNRCVREGEGARGVDQTADVIAVTMRNENVGDGRGRDPRDLQRGGQFAGARSHVGAGAGVEQHHTLGGLSRAAAAGKAPDGRSVNRPRSVVRRPRQEYGRRRIPCCRWGRRSCRRAGPTPKIPRVRNCARHRRGHRSSAAGLIGFGRRRGRGECGCHDERCKEGCCSHGSEEYRAHWTGSAGDVAAILI